MALVEKNDIKQIFADQAPSIDKPASFANYPRGWDVARPNNGKPTIKQFNYLQQRTDQNFLWMHQNGAALPYDATMEYAEGAVVVKDGKLQRKNGAAWVNVGVSTAAELMDESGKSQQEINDRFSNSARYSVLDFIPKQYHAEIFQGTSSRDFSSYINNAASAVRGDLIFPRGVITIGKPLLLNRGVRFLGHGPFDTITTGSSTIKLLNGANCTAIQTPVAAGLGVATHFMALENLLIEGNRKNQTEMHPVVQFHGAWVGSWLRNVFIKSAYGKALEFDKGADVQVDHLWIQDTVCGNDYALDFNPSYKGTSTRAGLMNMDHIYIENTGIESFDNAQSVNAPRNDPNNRGKALNVFALNSMNINEIHIEGCLRPIDVDSTHQTRIGKVTCAFIGKDGVDDVAIVRALGGGMTTLKVDTASITTGKTGTVYGVKKAAGVDLPAIQDRALTGTISSMVGYEAIASYTADTAKATPPLSVLQTVNVMSRGVATPILKLHNSQDLTITSNQYTGLKYTLNGVGLYSTLNQSNSAEVVLLDIYTPTVTSGNVVRAYAPLRLMDERATANNISDGSVTRVSTSQGKGLAYTFAASSFNFLSTVVIGTSAPTAAPNHIGQTFVDTVSKKCYMATGIATATDWTLLN